MSKFSASQEVVLGRSSIEGLFRSVMIVCSCNVLSDGQVRDCLNPGPECPRTAAQVYECLGCSPKCGRCARTIRGILASALMGESHACSTSCAATCPLAKAADHDHSTAPAFNPALVFATA